jgi:gamma-glutamylaminecyclotransferase
MRIFVYGTLKRGLSNHRWISDQQFITEARTEPVYRMYDCGGFPGMIPVAEDGVSILGEIWEVDEPGRKKLDILEDVEGGEYALELARLADADPGAGGEEDPIYTYLYKRSTVTMRDAGTDWRI